MNFCFVFSYEPWLLPPALEMIDVMKDEGHDIYIIYSKYVNTDAIDGDYDPTLTYAVEDKTRIKHYLKPYYLAKHIRRLLAEKPIDVIVACDIVALQALTGIKTGAKKGYWCFEVPNPSRNLFSLDHYRYSRLKPWLKKMDFYLAPSASRDALIRKKFDVSKPSAVIYNCRKLAESPFDAKATYAEYEHIKHRLIYTGRISETQFISEIIDAMELVSPDAGLILAGTGDKSYIDGLKKKIAQGPLLKNRVFYLGRISRDDVYELIDWADIGFVLYRDSNTLGRIDPAPNKTGDYIAGRIWTIGTDQDYIKYWLETKKAGVCVHEVNKQTLADSINELLTNPAYKDKNVLSEVYRSELNMNLQFDKFDKLIHSLQ